MPHFISDLPNKLRMVLSQAANLFLVVVMIYIFQYIFNSQFTCSCVETVHMIVFIYVLLVPVILFFILKLMNQTRTKVSGTCCYGVCPQLVQLFGISLFWLGCVLLDGDLYVCIMTKQIENQREIPCKSNRSLHEDSIITVYKNWSQFYGYIMITAGFIGWWLVSNTKIVMICIWCWKCCCPCLKNSKGKPFYRTRYEELLSEETDVFLDTKLREIAKKRAERLCSNHILLIEELESVDRLDQNCDASPWDNISRPDFYEMATCDATW